MTEIYLIRHGETNNNLEYRCNGQRSNQPLNEKGRAQAAALSAYFSQHPVDRVYTSDLSRAKETAMLAFRMPEESLYPDAGLREVDLGDWDGRLYTECARLYPTEWEQNRHKTSLVQFPGGESGTGAADRILQAFLRIVRENRGKRVAIVAHEMILVMLLTRIFGWDLDRKGEMGGISNTGFDLLQIDEENRATVQIWNYTDHLTGDLWNEADYATDFDRVAAECAKGGILPL